MEEGSSLNTPNGSACPLPHCPDHYGTMPSCAGLAVPYVPFQQVNPKQYAQDQALSAGTLFPGLNLPFHLKTENSTLPDTPMAQLQAHLSGHPSPGYRGSGSVPPVHRHGEGGPCGL